MVMTKPQTYKLLATTNILTKEEKLSVAGLIAGIYGERLLKQIVAKAFTNYVDVNQASINFIEGAKIGNFKFHITNRESINFESDITDNYIDTNCAIQDHVVKKPITITLTGVVGRYYHDISEDISRDVTYYRNFNLINKFIPTYPIGVNVLRKAKQFVSRATGSSGIVNRIANSFMSYSYGWIRDKLTKVANDYLGIYKKNVKVEDTQTDAFLYLEQLWNLSLPITVKTSWKAYENMYITSLKPQRDENADITEFTVTFKQVSKISSIVVNTKDKITAGNREAQIQDVSNNGKTSGVSVEVPKEKLKFTDEVPNIIKVK